MKELTFTELISIDGGSEATRAAGKEAGAAARDFFDDACTAWTIVSIAAFLIFKVPV